jgi:uncharacterized phage protein (TIGR01671 family)
MREILFRGKTRITGNWIYGFYGENTTTKEPQIVGKNDFCYSLVIPETVGQYTGLTDKNGAKVFEGDVVIWCRIKGIVVWEGHKFYIKSNLLWDFSDDDCIEVIGNIHDNPELLKGGEG